MNSLVLAILAFGGYLIAYHVYGKYIAKKIFNIKDTIDVPAHEFNDGVDFVPSKKNILFGHHFTTIAGLGPIVGPAIGIIWGWLPAFIWVFFGSIFMGAFHDFASLMVSVRSKGKTIGELTGDLISPSTRVVFQSIMQFLLWIVLAVFAMIVGVLFEMYPEAVFPVWMQIPIAVALGWTMRKGYNETLGSIIAVVFMYISIIIGIYIPIKVPAIMGSSVVTWSLILYVYVFFASTLPVQKLLQPRDYINSHQLLVAIVLLLAGLVVAHPKITAPAINPAALLPGSDIPSMAPLLFITIACGAISGFHSLASSGTTVKQMNNEKDALFIGYGGMIWESFLAVLVILSIAGGLGIGLEEDGQIFKGVEAYQHHYASWVKASGLGAKLNAFIIGGANLFESIGIPNRFGKPMIVVFIVSFANTTLDSSARIQRLSLQELTLPKNGKKSILSNRYFSTFMVVIAAAALTFLKPGAQGALILWPMFGALNQLLAALALGIISIYLYRKNKNILISFIPMLFILAMTVWAMMENLITFYAQKDWVLISLSAVILILTFWLLIGGSKAVIGK